MYTLQYLQFVLAHRSSLTNNELSSYYTILVEMCQTFCSTQELIFLLGMIQCDFKQITYIQFVLVFKVTVHKTNAKLVTFAQPVHLHFYQKIFAVLVKFALQEVLPNKTVYLEKKLLRFNKAHVFNVVQDIIVMAQIPRQNVLPAIIVDQEVKLMGTAYHEIKNKLKFISFIVYKFDFFLFNFNLKFLRNKLFAKNFLIISSFQKNNF